jgi:hypothetical protein
MKEQKSSEAGNDTENQPQIVQVKNGSGSMGAEKALRLASQRSLKPDTTMMDTEVQSRSNRRRGRLSRDAMSKLGEVLEAYFDDVRKEGVPDRFARLLEKYDERNDKPATTNESSEERNDKGST